MSNLVRPAFSSEQARMIKATIMDETATDNDLALFGMVCQRAGLDPFSKQIFALKRRTKSGEKWSFQISIDGLRAIADRTGLFAGMDAPLFDEGLSYWHMMNEGRERPLIAQVTVYKIVQGQRCGFTGQAAWTEFAQYYGDKLADTWRKMPFLMLGKCAEGQALRKAFPVQMAEYEPTDHENVDVAEILPSVIDEQKAIEYAAKLGISSDLAMGLIKQAKSREELFEQFRLYSKNEEEF